MKHTGIRGWRRRALGVALLIAPLVFAEEHPGEPDFEIPGPHLEVQVRLRESVAKPDLLPEEAREQSAPSKPEDPMAALQFEVETIRDEIRLLQSTLDLMINKIMADLREENEVLRNELRRLYHRQESRGFPSALNAPRPGMDLFDEVLAEEETYEDDSFDMPDEEVIVEPGPFIFTSIHEWGRTPEMVEELGGDAVSLKGIVGVVPRGSSRADIERLGRDLRDQYAEYDNINIEVFDDPATAHDFVETQIGNPAHRVLSVSKHGSAGRDVILYLDKGEAHEVARQDFTDEVNP